MKKHSLFYFLIFALFAFLSVHAQPFAPTTGVKYRMLSNRASNAFLGPRSPYWSTGTAYSGTFSTTLFQFMDQGSGYYAIQQASTGYYLNDRSNNGFTGSGGAMGYVASTAALADFQKWNFTFSQTIDGLNYYKVQSKAQSYYMADNNGDYIRTYSDLTTLNTSYDFAFIPVVLAVNKIALTPFTGAYTSETFSVTGASLNSDITITVPSGITLSGANVVGSAPTYTIAITNANTTNTITATYDNSTTISGESISVAADGMTTQNIAVSGTPSGGTLMTIITLTAATVNASAYSYKEVIIPGKTDLHIIGLKNQLNNSIVRLNSQNAWLFFDNVRPKTVKDSLLSKVYVNNFPARDSINVRVTMYKHGSVIIPHNYSFQPLTVYTGQNYTGDSASYSLYNRYTGLGAMDNKIRSFKLKRGYMATLATASDGMGYSRVFIADKEDINVPVLPTLLDQTVSFIRTFDWHWATKKGFAGGPVQTDQLNGTWRYDWGAGGLTTCNLEYTPMRPKLNWPGFNAIWNGTGFNNVLGLNEPDHPEQHKDDNGAKAVTVDQAISQWPDFIRSGLRLGSPACTSFGWLYQFLDSCRVRNYRVDYVAIHAYWGAMSPATWYSTLKYIHDRSGGLPIWITEWNNGANWTTESWPGGSPITIANDLNMNKELSDLKGILNVMDTAHFVERYSIYSWVGAARNMYANIDSSFMANNPGYANYVWLKTAPVVSTYQGKLLNGTIGTINTVLTPAGQYYRDNISAMSFNRVNEVIPTYNFSMTPGITYTPSTKNGTIVISDNNGDYFKGLVIEKKINNGVYTEILNTDDGVTKSYTENIDLTPGTSVKYRAKSKLTNNIETNYTAQFGYDVTHGTGSQYGYMSAYNAGWNPVYFNAPYASSTTPAFVSGGATNHNATLISPRIRYVSPASRYNVQLAAWAYQGISQFSALDSVPYFSTTTSAHNFGGLNAAAARVTVGSTWTTVTFNTPFDVVPVVFANQLSSSSANATVVRIRNVSKTGFDAKIMKESAITTVPASESITYLAIVPGTGSVDNNKLIVGRTGSTDVNTVASTIINYGSLVQRPIFLTQFQTCNDDTVTANIRCTKIGTSSASVIKQREKSLGITTASSDGAGWMVIEAPAVTSSVSTVQSVKPGLFPNPATDNLYIQGETDGNVISIYNISGVLCKQTLLNSNRIDINDLTPGCYILVNGMDRFRFIKK